MNIDAAHRRVEIGSTWYAACVQRTPLNTECELMLTVLEQGDREELMAALRHMAQALGGVTKLAESAQLNATTLYRTLSPKGNPELKSMAAPLKAMGMRLAVQPIQRKAH